MIELYLNKEVSYKKRLDETDDYNVPLYEEETTLSVNKQSVDKYVRNLDSEEKRVNNLYFTTIEVFTGDLIEGNEIISVEPDETLDGTVIAYEAYTE